MKRRSFLGFLGGAAVAGPSMAKSAADMAMSDLAVTGNGLGGFGSAPPYASVGSTSSDRSWARESLGRLLGKSAETIAYEKRSRSVHGLEPDVASMRSLSMRAKICMSRERQYDRDMRRERENLQGHIAGWWS